MVGFDWSDDRVPSCIREAVSLSAEFRDVPLTAVHVWVIDSFDSGYTLGDAS